MIHINEVNQSKDCQKNLEGQNRLVLLGCPENSCLRYVPEDEHLQKDGAAYAAKTQTVEQEAQTERRFRHSSSENILCAKSL